MLILKTDKKSVFFYVWYKYCYFLVSKCAKITQKEREASVPYSTGCFPLKTILLLISRRAPCSARSQARSYGWPACARTPP